MFEPLKGWRFMLPEEKINVNWDKYQSTEGVLIDLYPFDHGMLAGERVEMKVDMDSMLENFQCHETP